MEKCIGCELCAGVCPAKCIYVRGADNPPDAPVSPGERYGFVYEINYLRCIHCDLCVEACPTEAITETKLFEFSFANREDAIYTKTELLVDDDGRARRQPWELWLGGEDDHTSALDARHRAVAARRCTRVASAGPASSASACGRPRSASRPPRTRTSSREPAPAEPVATHRHRARRSLTHDRGHLLHLRRARARRRARRGARAQPGALGALLVVTLVSVAVLFIQQDAHLLAAVQVIVYAGAIVVLFLFVIMLLGVDREESLDDPLPHQRAAAIVLGAIAARRGDRSSPATTGPPAPRPTGPRVKGGDADLGNNVERVAAVLFTDFLWPFEITAALLVIAVVGSVVLARRSGQPVELVEEEVDGGRRRRTRSRVSRSRRHREDHRDLLPRARGDALHHRRGRRCSSGATCW